MHKISILFMHECDFKRSSIMAIFNLMPMQSTQWPKMCTVYTRFYVLKSSITFSMSFTQTNTLARSYRCTSANYIYRIMRTLMGVCLWMDVMWTDPLADWMPKIGGFWFNCFPWNMFEFIKIFDISGARSKFCWRHANYAIIMK